jgi:transposase-like protein
MSPRKLSDGDRQEILELYCNTEETTSTLAVRFGVSSSTVSRFLKTSLSDLEYEDLIKKKRLARTIGSSGENDPQAKLTLTSTKELGTQKSSSEVIANTEEFATLEAEIVASPETSIEEILIVETPSNVDRPVLRSAKVMKMDSDNFLSQSEEDQGEGLEVIIPKYQSEEDIVDYTEIEEEEEDLEDDDDDLESVNVLAAMFGEDIDDDEDEDEDEDDDDDDEIQSISKKNFLPEQLQVLPLAKATFPRVCYLVIDRYSELITKPLREFADLGTIPRQETQQRTLPVFDNHRVAKRFCDRKGKVIKVPDGRILQKTSPYLQAKGISRILMDGKIYSLV